VSSALSFFFFKNGIFGGEENVLGEYYTQGGYSEFQVTGMIEWGQKSIPKKIPRGFQQNPKKSLDEKFTPKKSHAEIPSLNFQKGLNDLTRKKNH